MGYPAGKFLNIKFILHDLLDFSVLFFLIRLDVDLLIEWYNTVVCETDFLNTSML